MKTLFGNGNQSMTMSHDILVLIAIICVLIAGVFLFTEKEFLMSLILIVPMIFLWFISLFKNWNKVGVLR